MFKVLKNGKKPTRGSKHSACVDLFASEDVTIGAGETKIVGLGVAIDLENCRDSLRHQITGMQILRDNLPYDKRCQEELLNDFKSSHFLQLDPRSSLRAKGLISGTGIIDMDYPKEIKIIITNPIRMVDYNIGENTMTQFGAVDEESKRRVNAKYARDYEIKKGDKIAQITLIEHKSNLFGIESEDEREDGFGSTGE